MAESKQSQTGVYYDQVIKDGDPAHGSTDPEGLGESSTENVSHVSETITTVRVEESVNESFKEKFLEAQRKLLDLEGELKGTRQYLRNLEDACENTEEKINGLKDAAILYQRSVSQHEVSIAEENQSLKMQIENYEAALEGLEKEKKHAKETRVRAVKIEIELEKATKEINRLLGQLDSCERAEANSKHVRDTAAELSDELAMMKSECTLHCTRINKLTEENEALKKEKSLSDALMSELKALKLECDEIESENEQLEHEKQELRAELGVLVEKVRALEVSQEQRDKNVDKAVDDTQSQLDKADNYLEQLKQQVLDQNEQVQELEDNCDQSRTRNIELEKELSALHFRIQELENNLDSELKEKQELQKEWKKKVENQNKHIVQLENHSKEISREQELLRLQLMDCKNKSEMEVRNFTRQLNEAQVRCEIFKKEVAVKERELQASLQEKEKYDNEYSSLERQLNCANDDIAQLQKMNKCLKDEFDLLKGQSPEKVEVPNDARLLSAPPPLADSESDLSDLEEEIIASKDYLEVEAAPEQPTAWSDPESGEETVEDMLRRALEDKKNLERELAEAEQKAEQTADELSETIRCLNDRAVISQGKDVEHSNKTKELEEQVKQLQEENEHLEAELEKAHHELSISEKPEDNEVLEEKYESLEKKYNELVSKTEVLQQENEELGEERDSLLEEVEEWQNDFEAGKQKYQKLCSENETLKNEKKKLEEELTKKRDAHSKEMENQLKSQRAKITERLKRLKAEAENTDDSFEKEDETVSEWREMYFALRTRFDQIERVKITVERERDGLQRKCNNMEDELDEVRSKYSRMRREVSDAHGEVSNLRQQLSEYRSAKDTAEKELKKQKQQCTKHLKELENLIAQLSRENNDEGLLVKFESLKLEYEELEGEKESLQKERNNLQYKLHTSAETLAENEIKLKEVSEEKQSLEQDLKKVQSENTELEMVLERTTKQKEQEEQQCTWYKNELMKKEEIVNELEQKIHRLETDVQFTSEKAEGSRKEADDLRTRAVQLEGEVERLKKEIGAKREQDKADSACLRARVAQLEADLENLKADLDCKSSELEEREKEKESLSLHTVELKREIQCLYARFEATQAQVAELQRVPPPEQIQVTELQRVPPPEQIQVTELQSTPPPEPQKAENTTITIDVESKPEIELDILIAGQQRDRIPGLERKISVVKIPMNSIPGGVKTGSTSGATVDSEDAGPVTNSTGLLASESDDEVFPPPPEEALISPDEQVGNFSSPPRVLDERKPATPTPERITVSAQALPQPQIPRSLDARRFPLITDSGVRLRSGAFQSVPVRSREIPDEHLRRPENGYQSHESRFVPGPFKPLPGRPYKALSEPGDLGKMQDLNDEPVLAPELQDWRRQEEQVRWGTFYVTLYHVISRYQFTFAY